jgi:hypothetical protein
MVKLNVPVLTLILGIETLHEIGFLHFFEPKQIANHRKHEIKGFLNCSEKHGSIVLIIPNGKLITTVYNVIIQEFSFKVDQH